VERSQPLLPAGSAIRHAFVCQTGPRATRLGPFSGTWARIDLAGDRYWVDKRFHDQIRSADQGR
jgi:hypothetical protein